MRRIIKRTVTTVTTVTTTITWSDEAPAAEAQPAPDSSISTRPDSQRPAAEEDSAQDSSDAP
jgi:hypothetical protein